ncbi:MAG: DUF3037 domain-containing protein [Acidobacteria bacterium]|nr:DUF3037 domain-containing protein [Acidobacteriota bacterium]
MTPCEYFLVQYVPFPREELRLPIGLIFFEDGGKRVRHAMTRDWRAVLCLDPRADLTLLHSLPAFFATMVEEHRALDAASGGGSLRRELFRMAETNFGTVQIARPRGVETEDPVREFDRLFEEHVASRRIPVARSAPRAGSRRWIQSRLCEALERSPFWNLLHKNISVEEFTAPGDRFQIDFSYRPNGVTKYLHALSLEHDWNQAKVLSYTFSKIRARIPAAITAIVADEGPRVGAAHSCQRILLDSGISIHPLTSLDGLVDQIQQELGPVI